MDILMENVVWDEGISTRLSRCFLSAGPGPGGCFGRGVKQSSLAALSGPLMGTRYQLPYGGQKDGRQDLGCQRLVILPHRP